MPKLRLLAWTLAILAVTGLRCGIGLAADDIAGAATLRAKAAREGRVRIIVERRTDLPQAADLGPTARPLGTLPFAALEVGAAELEALLASGAVRKVGENRRVRPHLRESVPLVRAPAAWAAGGRGDGQTIVVIDTGVRASHPFLGGRVVRSICSAADCGARIVDRQNGGEPFAGCPSGSVVKDHGTHVAGIAAGEGRGFSGVAPGAQIVSIRVFRCGEADWEYVIRALDYVATDLAGRHRIAAVNMSLGDDILFAAACDDVDATYAALAAAVGKLRRLGIATVASTGNDGDKRGIAAPACLRDVIAVGSTDKDDQASWFTNSAANLDLLAPGADIYSSLAGGGFGFLNGTSMAAPHVAGAIAVLRSKLPAAGLAAIEDALTATGPRVTDVDNGLRRPRLDVAAALNRLEGGRAPAWHGWQSLAGRIAGPPECLPGDGGPADCWAPLAGGGLGYWPAGDMPRTPPVYLGGKVASPATCLRAGGALHCFATTPSRRLALRVQRAGRWQPWQDLGGTVRDRPACVSVEGGSIDCVALGTDGRLRWRSRRGGGWGAWRIAVGGLAANAAPACHARAGGVDCLVTTASGKVHALRLSAGRRWQAPLNLGGSVSASGACTAPGGDRLACFFRGRDGSLRQIAFNGTRWGGWRDLGGGLRAAPTCVARGQGRILCVGVAADGKLRERRFDGTTWLPWRGLAGALAARPLACVAFGGARVDCFGQGRDGALKRNAYF